MDFSHANNSSFINGNKKTTRNLTRNQGRSLSLTRNPRRNKSRSKMTSRDASQDSFNTSESDNVSVASIEDSQPNERKDIKKELGKNKLTETARRLSNYLKHTNKLGIFKNKTDNKSLPPNSNLNENNSNMMNMNETKTRTANIKNLNRNGLAFDIKEEIKQKDTYSDRIDREYIEDSGEYVMRERDASAKRKVWEEMSETKKCEIRETNTRNRRHAREEMNEVERDYLRELNTSDRRNAREEMNEVERDYLRELNTSDRRNAREEMIEVERDYLREGNTSDRRKARDEMNEEERDYLRERNTSDRRNDRDEINDIRKDDIQLKDLNARRMAKTKLTEEQREQLRQHQRVAKNRARRNYNNMVDTYEQEVLKGPNNICLCCGGLFFERTLVVFDEEREQQRKDTNLLEKIIAVRSEKMWICLTCKKYYNKDKVPLLALNDGLAFPVVDKRILELTDLEERLVAPRIAFMKIRPLKKYQDGQMGLIGNVVNVPIDHNEVIRCLPRTFEDTETMQIKFKRRLDYNNNLMFDKIRPKVVLDALHFLCSRPLFKKNKITESLDWQKTHYTKDVVNFIIDKDTTPMNNDESDEEFSQVISCIQSKKNLLEIKEIDYFAADNNNFENQDTLLYNVENEIGVVAPGENQEPLSILSDKYSEEMTFIKIYGGEQICEYLHSNKLTYQAICKSEFRRYDRRAAEDVNKIFYSFKKLIAKKLLSSVEICLKKTKQTENITVANALNKRFMEELLIKSEGQLMLRSARYSPQFWQWKKMELYAMIRQLGAPTLFLTFSPAESDWLELIIIIYGVKYNKIITVEEARDIPLSEKQNLLSKDPITVARYFENRMIALLKIALGNGGVFNKNPVREFFWRVDFQYRGSAHIHCLVWLEKSPVYVEHLEFEKINESEYIQNLCECVKFIDRYITVERPKDDIIQDTIIPTKQVNIKYQLHKCYTDNCLFKNKEGIIMCKYGFPWPILNETIILEPLPKNCSSDKILKYMSIYQKLRDILNNWAREAEINQNFSMTEDDLRDELNITDIDFFNALRYSITRITVFLKRDSRSIRINAYNKELIVRHRANMDIQYILDPYGIALYVSAYILKSKAVMSKLLKNCENEMKLGCMDTKRKLITLSNKFQNCTEIGAQEAVYNLLSMRLVQSSRDVVYINTYPMSSRDRMVKSKQVLNQMNKNSTNIYAEGILEHYAVRNKKLDNVCLAEYATWFEYYANSNMLNSVKPVEEHNIPRFQEEDDEVDEDLLDKSAEPEIESDEILQIQQELTEEFMGFIPQLDGKAYVRKRKSQKIIRCKRYNKIREPIEYYRVDLLLYYPWRNEQRDINLGELIENHYIECEEIIQLNKARFEYVEAERFEQAMDEIENEIVAGYEEQAGERADIINKAHTDMHKNDDYSSESKSNSEDSDQAMSEVDIENLEEEYGYHYEEMQRGKVRQTNLPSGHIKFADPIPYPRLMQNVARLNEKQQILLQEIITYIFNNKIFNIFLSGGSGTGKSEFINTLYQVLLKMLNPSNLADNMPVLIGAYTGKAAYKINGFTLNTLFKLPLKYKGDLPGLSNKKLLELRKKFMNVKLLIIDEISMLGCDMWHDICKRLMEIKGSKELFGGISVLVVGDFNQLQPIKEKSIYETSSGNVYGGLITTSIWSSFKLYELTEIMRQKDDLEYANILNKIGNEGLEFCTKNEVSKLNTRIVDSINNIPEDAIILSFKNEDVLRFNRQRILESKGELIILKSVNVSLGPDEGTKRSLRKVEHYMKNEKLEETCFLPLKIYLKIGRKYMLTLNMNLSDGLCNGTVGILRKIIMEEDNINPLKPKVARVWMEFEGLTGRDQRSRNIQLKEDDKISATECWTPLSCTAQTVFRPKQGNYRIQRIQLPMIESEAMTIHKSQGQTFSKVAVNIDNLKGQQLTQKLMYVALSRCEKLKGLYLLGTNSIRPKELTEKELIKKAAEKSVEKGRLEMIRLRTQAPLELKFDFAQEKYQTQHLTVMFQNVCNIGDKFDKLFTIENNIGFRHADIIFLVECHTNIKNTKYCKFKKDEYTILPSKEELSHGTKINSSHGQICFVRKSIENRIKYIARNKKEFSTNNCAEIEMFKYTYGNGKMMFLISLYFHPEMNESQKAEELNEFLKAHIPAFKNPKQDCEKPDVIIFGDFNSDLNIDKNGLAIRLHRLGFYPILKNSKTQKSGNQLDWVFTNRIKTNRSLPIVANAYPTWYSDHAAIHSKIMLCD